MRLLVDTGVLSASRSLRRRAQLSNLVQRMAGNQVFVAAVTVSELRYGALVGGWGPARRRQLEEQIGTATMVPVTDRLLWQVAELRYACRRAGHPLAAPVHANDLWIAASAIHVGAPLLTADSVFDGTPDLELHT